MRICPTCGRKYDDDYGFCGECGEGLEEDRDHLEGIVIKDTYEIGEKIAEGRMGAVFKGRHVKEDNEVAIRVLYPEYVRDVSFIARLEDEFEKVTKLKHENIVGVLDSGGLGLSYFIVMDFKVGKSLRDIIDKKAPIPVDDAFTIALHVARGLEYAHDNAIVHKSLSPRNILVDDENNAGIMGFGIADAFKSRGRDFREMLVWTPEYVSPEDIGGKEPDSGTDLYALGVILYEMITGTSPFGADTLVNVITRVLKNDVRPAKGLMPELSDEAAGIIDRAISREANKRFITSRYFIEAIKQVIEPVIKGLSIREFDLFRGNPARTGVYDTGGVPELKGLLWEFKTDGLIFSSPAVMGDIVYFGSGDGHLYAVDAGEGKEKWRFMCGAEVDSSPAAFGEVVYFGSSDGHLYALAADDGREIWRFKTRGEIKSSPVVSDGLVYFGSRDGNLYAVDIKNGQEKWHFDTGNDVDSSPAVSSGIVYCGSGNGHLYARNSKDGKELWRFPTDRGVFSSPAVDDSVVYFGSFDGHLYAVDAKKGKLRWRFANDRGILSSPAIYDGVVFFGSYDRNLYAVDAVSGKERWCFETGSEIDSSPIVSDEVIYFGNNDSYLYAADVKDGSEKWRFRAKDIVWSSPCVASGVVYFGSDGGYLYAVG